MYAIRSYYGGGHFFFQVAVGVIHVAIPYLFVGAGEVHLGRVAVGSGAELAVDHPGDAFAAPGINRGGFGWAPQQPTGCIVVINTGNCFGTLA